ncbi:MAG: segregation and condensation protein B [Parcubacteria group bacterium Gr01-1014_48]|nr:MAG: segregation and condensation protein B [Parcubacteria group bacterium Greene0416_14]TSC74148.1 MAG: segregation and condensation protein B [Parcubacteria group bacterium Gr01-1014_48]TSD01695.1 MAG: segregation and condensation protein B [Parcubacteria group bacterium Greene1014_15]TSD08171.1 MAG: segregation and condensation protein B [Parcubacteria group bacterium Greene0714_4]
MTLDALIEAILFYKGEPTALSVLATITKEPEEHVERALIALEGKLQGRGIALIRHDHSVMLVTAGAAAQTIELMQKDELSRDLSKAALETLTIILYRGPISRPQIDYIRGVNSQFILRALLVRGLVEKTPDSQNSRTVLYQGTTELMGHMGISRFEDLPEYAGVREKTEASLNSETTEIA